MEAEKLNEEEPRGKYTTVSIPITLYRRIKEMIKDTGLTSVSQSVIYILIEVISSMEEEKIKGETLSEEEKERIIERLKKLGYV